jgi:phosphoglycolate phosphatase
MRYLARMLNRASDSIVFDLDGTLWDTTRACVVAWNSVLQRLEIPFRDINASDVRKVTGMPHAEAIRNAFAGLSDHQLELLTEFTASEDNRMISELGGDLYPGVREGLSRLSGRFNLYIVSNCQAGYIETFLAQSGFQALFRDFECWGNTGRSKSDNLKSVIERNGLRQPVFVGDTRGDHQAAIDAGVPFLQVTYGFGDGIPNVSKFGDFHSFTENMLGA